MNLNKLLALVFLTILVLFGVIWLNGKQNADKEQISLITIAPTELEQKSKFKVFFGTNGNPKEGEDCKPYSPVERESEFTIFPEKDAIDELLKGPSEDEKVKGFYTNINDGVVLQKIVSKDGKVEVDFSKNLETGVAGSCKVEFIRSQIETTLKQFSGIDAVIISINGRSEDILQP